MDNNSIAVQCPCCGINAWNFIYKLPKTIFYKKYEIYACANCGCGITIPIPKVDVSFYHTNSDYDKLFNEKENLYLKFAEQLLNFIGDSGGNRLHLLDVGCGGGFLVQAAGLRGYQAKGIEANANMAKWAKRKGLSVFNGDLYAFKEFTDQKFDVIVLSAVLEHLQDPRKLLKDCIDMLTADGIVVVSQASFDGLLPKILPWGWYGWQPEQHYWHFSANSFSRMALSLGLNIEKLERNSLYHPWFISGGIRNIVGRNLVALIDVFAHLIKRGDSFNISLSNNSVVNRRELVPEICTGR